MAFRNTYSAGINPAFAGPRAGAGGSSSLSSSISSLSGGISSRYGHAHGRGSLASSNISKTYRQASTLFLTRRLPEALTTLLPLITPPAAHDPDGRPAAHKAPGSPLDSNGDFPGPDAATSSAPSPALPVEPAPVASASRTTRVKVWSLYLTILNAVLELEPDEGKDAFGTQDWRSLCAKVRDGDVWEEVVRNGYHGAEGDVDADVVINLATLLLAHATSQELNQRRLESYLASAQTLPTGFDLSGRFAASPARRSMSRHRSPARRTPGADTPRDLNARVKILELYTLHVLLRNDQWAYAREFIAASPLLDEERREAFLQALQSLHDEHVEAEQRAAEERRAREEEAQRDLEASRRIRAANEAREHRRIEEERARRRGGSGGGGGGGSSFGGSVGMSEADGDAEADVDANSNADANAACRRHRPPSSAGESSSTRGGARSRPSKTSRSTQPPAPSASSETAAAAAPPPPGASAHASKTGRAPSAPRARAGKGKGKAVARAAAPPPSTLGGRTALLFSSLRGFLEHMSIAFQTTPLALLRTLLFVLALLALLARQSSRERLSRVLASVWTKVKATAGMGVKVSYI